MLNLHPLFNVSEPNKSSFLNELTLLEEQKKVIDSARTEVRNCLRTGMSRVMRRLGHENNAPAPRFFTQGSWAYKTINSPAQGQQQADIDDGAYLPLSFLSQTKRPSVASAAFFQAAEECLAELAREKGWKLVTTKATCVRLVITSYAHIDIPLYAIPDREFELLVKARTSAVMDSANEAFVLNEQDRWDYLPPESVLLAHREEDWKASDPRPIKQWFLDAIFAKGEQLRRVVRYLKAFRDWQWESGGPSSILLMAAAVPIFEKRDGRDDLALLEVVRALPAALRKGVLCPVDDQESLTKRLGPQKVEEAAVQFEELERYLAGAIHSTQPLQACTWLREKFGTRFPNRPEDVRTTSVAAAIAAAPAVAGPSELVGRTQAG